MSLDGAVAGGNNSNVRGHLILIAGIGLGLGSTAAAADPPPICADRPGKATSACTVPVGDWQLETGLADWSLQKTGGERDTSLTIGETTVKYGLTESSDIEVDITPWERATSSFGGMHQSASGIGDIRVIFKQALTGSSSPVQVIAMPYVKVPSANRSLGNGKVDAGMLFPMAYPIPKTPFSLGATPEFDWVADADGHGHHLAMEQVVTVGWTINDKLTFSPELWGAWDWDPSGTTKQYSADGSLAYLVNNNTQLDAGVDFGLNRQTPGVELYTGLSVRF